MPLMGLMSEALIERLLIESGQGFRRLIHSSASSTTGEPTTGTEKSEITADGYLQPRLGVLAAAVLGRHSGIIGSSSPQGTDAIYISQLFIG